MLKSGPVTGDRRRVCRYPVVLQHAHLGWWRDSSFTHVPARLVDLSLNGCRLELDQIHGLRAQQSVWVHFHKGALLEWLEGRIVAVRKPLLRKCEVRMFFQTPLGYEPFKKVVYGTEYLRDDTQKSTPEHEQDHFWK